MSYTIIGQPVPRIEGPAKVTGATQYSADVALPGTLWGRALRSPLPHARIVHIDTSRTQQVPGVHVVLTGADVRGIRYGRRLFDVPVLAEDRVRFAGERVVAVAAEDRDAAEEALALIDVEYEELPAVFDCVHENLAERGTGVPAIVVAEIDGQLVDELEEPVGRELAAARSHADPIGFV